MNGFDYQALTNQNPLPHGRGSVWCAKHGRPIKRPAGTWLSPAG